MVRAQWKKSNSGVKSGTWIWGDMLCHWRWHLIQSAGGTTLDSPHRHCLIHSSSRNEICWGRWKSENIDYQKASVQRSWSYFTDFLFYQDSLEVDENPHSEELDSGNNADTEPEKDECLWEINLLVTSINKINFDTNINVEGEWFIDKDLDLAYFSSFASDSVSSDTSTDIGSDPLSALNALTSLHAPTKSSLIIRKDKRCTQCLLWSTSQVKRSKANSIWKNRV